MAVSVLAVLILALATGRAQHQPLTSADLANNGTFEASFEGSWSYYTFDPVKVPLSIASIGYMTFSDRDPHLPLWPSFFGLTGVLNGSMITSLQCEDLDYVWRPDFVLMAGSCNGIQLKMEVGYKSNSTLCVRYNVTNSLQNSVSLQFGGKIPNNLPERTMKLNAVGSYGSVAVNIASNYAGDIFRISRWWLMQSDDASLTTQNTQYQWTADVSAGATESLSFSFTEMETDPSLNPPQKSFAYNVTSTTASINDWLAELEPLDKDQHALQYYTAWFQFWFNTEHDGGYWSHPVITPSMGTYGRGMWLWDTGFHVMALLTGAPNGARALQKAKDQLSVMTEVGLMVGHIPRVIGPSGIETTTQPPGILTWASLIVYNVTQDKVFLKQAYDAFGQNNLWFHANRSDSTKLCQWEGTDSGWDTSPRWDKGIVDAIDLNSWLYLDELLLAQMATILGRPEAEITSWSQSANTTAKSIQEYLWDANSGVFWDRLPPVVPCSTLKGPFCDCHGGCTATNHRCSCTSCGSCNDCPNCQCCSDSGDTEPGDFVSVVTPATFWTMLAGIATKDQAESMMAKFLTPDNLMTPYPMPCVGKSEKVFDPTQYWRGPVWVNVNWLSLLGWECYGHVDQANTLRQSIVGEIGMHPYPREYYNPLNGEGLGAENFMWTGAIDIVVINELRGRTLVRDILHDVTGCGSK